MNSSGSKKHDLPQGWQWVTLGEVCKQDRQIIEPGSLQASQLPYLSLEHVERHSGRIMQYNNSGAGKSTTFAFDSGHVLYGKLRPYLNKVALPDRCGRCTTEMIPLRPNQLITREILCWLLRHPRTVQKAMKGITGSRMPRANMEELLCMEIPLPPMVEQKRIDEYLNKQLSLVLKAREAAEKRVSAAHALSTSYIRKALRCTSAQEWRLMPFGELVENYDGQRVPIRISDRRGIKGEYPYYGATGVIDYVNKYIFDGEYLLIGEDGANLLSRTFPIAFKVQGKFWVNNHAHVVQPKDEILIDYLIYYFQLTDLEPYVAGAAQPKLTQSKLNTLPVPVPPLRIQQQIVESLNSDLSKVQTICDAAHDELAALTRLSSAILQNSFAVA